MAGRGPEQRPQVSIIAEQGRTTFDILLPPGAEVTFNIRSAVGSSHTIEERFIPEDVALREDYNVRFPRALQNWINSSLTRLSHGEGERGEVDVSRMGVDYDEGIVDDLIAQGFRSRIAYREQLRLLEEVVKTMQPVGEVHVGEVNPHIRNLRHDVASRIGDLYEIPEDERPDL